MTELPTSGKMRWAKPERSPASDNAPAISLKSLEQRPARCLGRPPHGIPFDVVPGVSSIAAVPASALIPVTHRGISDRVTIASGRGADGSEPDYERLAPAGGTLVLFMGLERLPRLCAGLIGAGLPATTPAAVVSQGTLPGQESVTATLATLARTPQASPHRRSW